MTIFGDFLKYWEILGFFHSYTAFKANGTLQIGFLVMWETCHENNWGRGGVVPYERMASHSLSRVLVIKICKAADAHFLVSVVELTPFLNFSVCWFWVRALVKME